MTNFDNSLAVLLVGQCFGVIDLFWPIRFQYSICALITYCKYSFNLPSHFILALLLIVLVLHNNKIRAQKKLYTSLYGVFSKMAGMDIVLELHLIGFYNVFTFQTRAKCWFVYLVVGWYS